MKEAYDNLTQDRGMDRRALCRFHREVCSTRRTSPHHLQSGTCLHQEEYLLALRAKKELVKSPFSEIASSGNSLAESARRRLKLWDITDDQIKALEESGQPKKTVTLYSPFSGIVLEKVAYKGMNIMPGTALYKLADLSGRVGLCRHLRI